MTDAIRASTWRPSGLEKPMTKVTVSTTTHGCMPTTYHTTECPTVKRINGKREISKAEAEARGLKLCKRCDPEYCPDTGSKDFSIYQAALNHD